MGGGHFPLVSVIPLGELIPLLSGEAYTLALLFPSLSLSLLEVWALSASVKAYWALNPGTQPPITHAALSPSLNGTSAF